MAYLVTFDGVELKNPVPFDLDHNPVTKSVLLLSGKNSVQTSTETVLSVTFKCNTEDHADIVNLRAKIGLKKTLSINGTDYTKCVITGKFREKEWYMGKWDYEVDFIQDTTT